MARLARQRATLPVLLVLIGAGAAVSGCATVPSGGPPRAVTVGNNQVQAYVQPLPAPGPTSTWTPEEVVLGFLHASASYAFDPAAARQYLAPDLRKGWDPGHEPVALVGAPTDLTETRYHSQFLESTVTAEREVQFTGQQLATLSQSGQYEYAPGQNVQYDFVLARTNNVWLIQVLPSEKSLVLTESDFEEVYQPRNLFFFAPADTTAPEPPVLVPDPVYAPLQSSNSALNTDVATGLVNGLLKGQGSWLSGATYSAFPAGTRLLKNVTITGRTAYVDLGGAAANADSQQLLLMADQLAATLGDGEYSLPLASHVELSVNNSVQYSGIGPPGDLIPTVPSGPVEVLTGTSTVGQLPAQPGRDAKPQARLSQDQVGAATVTAVAASPGPPHPQQIAVAVQSAGGCAVEEQPSGQTAYSKTALAGSVGPCTSLSYDADGNLWAAAGNGVWVLQPNRAPAAVDLSAMSADLQPGDQIQALRMAPDAVRAALLVKSSAGNRLLLVAVQFHGGNAVLGQPVTVGASLTNPLAVSWYDAYHLAVLAGDGIYEVPLTGGAGPQPAPQLLSLAPTGAQALTTDGSELVVGTSQGSVAAEMVSAPGWLYVPNASNPIYPG